MNNFDLKRFLSENKLTSFERTNTLDEIDSNELLKSVYSLAKNNNGIFKSDAQAGFLKRMIDQRDGMIGSHEMYGNSVSVFAEYDDKGITKIYTHSPSTNRDVVKFTRISDDQFKANQERFRASKEAEISKANSGIAQNLQQRIDALKTDIRELGYEADKHPAVVHIINKQISKYESELADLERQLADLKG
jgi:hypothetical protein